MIYTFKEIKNLLTLAVLVLLTACQSDQNTLILVSKDPSLSYTNWLLSLDKNLKIREFYTIPIDSMSYFLEQADGMVMTGGEDVNPILYNKAEYTDLCEAPDNFRDSIERQMIVYGMQNNIPLLGICRGMQIINVINRGTLIPDIPAYLGNTNIAHRSEKDSAHVISPIPFSWISKEFNNTTFWVNSRHHQSVDDIADGFRASAFSADGIIESIELNENHNHPFVICVQWHPENLQDSLATALGNLFLAETE